MRDRKRIIAVILVVLTVVIVVAEWRARSIGPAPVAEVVLDTTESLVPVQEIVAGGLNNDGVPAINAPVFLSIGEVDHYLSDTQEGISVTIGSQTKFYPYQILVWHQVVNDSFGDTNIAVTYCPLCGAGLVYERPTGAVFGVSGDVWNSTLLMFDRETKSLWSQILGKAIQGERIGDDLSLIPSSIFTWAEWKKNYPRGSVLSKETGFTRDYTRNPYFGYEETTLVYFPLSIRDDRLHSKEIIYGYVGPDGEAKAYPLEYIVAEQNVSDTVAGRKVSISYNNGRGITVLGEDTDGEDLDVVLKPTYWFAWVAIYSDTELYDPLGKAKVPSDSEETPQK